LTAPSGADLTQLADTEAWASAGGAQTNTAAAVEQWTKAAQVREDVYLFEIAERDEPVGQIFLHDIDADGHESLVGYHLLANQHRGRGIGTEALQLLVDYVREETRLERLVTITAGDNARSRRIAEKGGFTLAGPPREDPSALCFKLEMER
jgi:RimJ/RimL family protein N-acetyltransferase